MSDDNNTTAPHAKPLDCDVNTLSVEEAIAFAQGTEDGNEIDANTTIIAEAEATANEAAWTGPPNPNDDSLPPLLAPQQPEIIYNSAPINYARRNNTLKSLVVMAIGLKKEDGTPLFNGEDEPWSSMIKVVEWKPTNDVIVEEIIRRWNVYNWEEYIKREPRPKRWGVKAAMEWLEAHPINWKADGVSVECEFDAKFVKEEIAVRKVQLEEAAATKAAQNAQLEGRWLGNIPALRMIHALIEHDNIKRAYLTRLHSLTRGELENRNSVENRDSTVWELIATVFNNPAFNPVTKILLLNHQDYMEEIDLSYSKVEHMAAATPDKCEEKFSSMTLALKRKIANWEASGQGDGGVLFEESGEDEFSISTNLEFGQLTGRPRSALERWVDFFRDVPSYLMYLWEMIEIHDLRRSCLQTLHADVAAGDGAGDVPSVFDNDGNDFLNNEDGSVASTRSLTSKSNKSAATLKTPQTGVKELHAIGEGMKKFHDRSIQLQRFEEKQKELDRDHATTNRIAKETHTSKERLLGEIDNLKREKRQYEWHLITHNSKRGQTNGVEDDDPTATAMKGFIDNIESDIQGKEKEVKDLDNRLNSLVNTSQRSNSTN